MNLKKLNYQNVKEGIYKVTPLELCNARIAGYVGTIFGALLSMIPMAMNRQWGWMVFIFFLGWLQVAALVGDIQTRKALKESEKQIAEAMSLSEEQLKEAMKQMEGIANK